MARKRVYTGQIVQIRVNQTQHYHRQWAIPRGDKKPYIISETVRRFDGSFFRNHQWLCGCMDWISRRQKFREPNDRCKHIDALLLQSQNSVEIDVTGSAFPKIEHIKTIPFSDYHGFNPKIPIRSNWSGSETMFYQIITKPKLSVAIEIEDHQGHHRPVGYIMGNTTHLAINESHLRGFDHKHFFNVLANRMFSPEESDLLLALEAQRDRMEKNFGEEVSSELQTFDGHLSALDLVTLKKLQLSSTIDRFETLGSSVAMYFDHRSIIHNGKSVWNGDYVIVIGKFPQFNIMGRNINASDAYRGAGIHPHVNSEGRPCLASYNKLVAEALSKREWSKFAVIVADFLTQYNPRSPYIHLTH